MVYPPSFDRQQSQDRAINCWSMSLARCQPCTVSAWNNLSLIVFAEIWCTNVYIYMRKFGVPKYITGTKILGCSLWVESSLSLIEGHGIFQNHSWRQRNGFGYSKIHSETSLWNISRENKWLNQCQRDGVYWNRSSNRPTTVLHPIGDAATLLPDPIRPLPLMWKT